MHASVLHVEKDGTKNNVFIFTFLLVTGFERSVAKTTEEGNKATKSTMHTIGTLQRVHYGNVSYITA